MRWWEIALIIFAILAFIVLPLWAEISAEKELNEIREREKELRKNEKGN